MLGMVPAIGSAAEHLQQQVQGLDVLKDPALLPHLAHLLGSAYRLKKLEDVLHVSNVLKQTHTQLRPASATSSEVAVPVLKVPPADRPCLLPKFSAQHDKLKWTGIALPREEVYLVDKHLTFIAETQQAEEVRFWGKILGTVQDYYVIQGRVSKDGGLEDIPKGAEKRGEGVNYYSFWVSNNLLSDQWAELPLVTPKHVKAARKIKKFFTG
jgi:hypothetical protein